MSLPRTVADVLRQHVSLELECVDRLYLNGYVPNLQHVGGVVGFFRKHRGALIASSALMAPISDGFVREVNAFAKEQGIPLVEFKKGQRKDDIAQEHLRAFTGQEGILFIGKAQEKASVYRTEKRRHPETQKAYPWIVKGRTAMVNHYYFYGVDRDFGPFFIKFCSYFPYAVKVCINGHEWLKRQLNAEGIPFTALDNGIATCADPQRMQTLAQELGPAQIERFFRRWLDRLPHPFTRADQEAGYVHQLSLLQAEFALTQVLDRPVSGRIFFEQVIREHLDLGRPSEVQLIFNRKVTKRTPGRFRTRVLTEGVVPTLHIDYKNSRLKQYYKEVGAARGLRTETTINNTRDFGIGKRLANLPALREIGFRANRRLLDVETTSHDCLLSEVALQRTQQPVTVGAQRASALRLTDPTVQALLQVLLLFRFLIQGFTNAELRVQFATLLGLPPSTFTPGKMTYHLRRLKLHGLITRIPGSNRYRVTEEELRTALFFTRGYNRFIRPAYDAAVVRAEAAPTAPDAPPANQVERRRKTAWDRLEKVVDDCWETTRMAA